MDKKKYSDLSGDKENIKILIETKYIVKLKRKGFDIRSDYITKCFIANKNIDDYKIPCEYHCNCIEDNCKSNSCECINNYAQKHSFKLKLD